MFNGTYDRAARADRYRKVAAEYSGLSEAATDPFLGSYYLRIAEDYQDQSRRELWALEREKITAHATPPATAQPRQLAQKSHQGPRHEALRPPGHYFNAELLQKAAVT